MTDHPAPGDRDWPGRLPAAGSLPLDEEQRARDEQMRRTSVAWAERMGFAPTDTDGDLIAAPNPGA